jgi:hypothetical protein
VSGAGGLYGEGGYWAQHDAIAARIRAERPRTLGALTAILNTFEPPSSGVAFFNDDDGDLPAALEAAGWTVRYEARYLWEAQSPTGEWMHYVEGDVYGGRNRR